MKQTAQTVLVYARASADPSDQRISVDRQVKLCTERARKLWPDADVKVFRDDAITAADPNVHRPGFADFLTAVRVARKGELAGVVVNEQSRLTRQGNGAWDELVITLTKAGVEEVQTLRAGPVSVAPGNRLVGRILAVVDAEEVERTKARVQVAHAELFKEGRPSGRAPFGYRSVRDADGRPAWEPDPNEAPVVRQVYAMALAGHSVTAIVNRLNGDGVPPRSARWTFKDGRKVTAWKGDAVRTVLTSPSVAGLRAHTDDDGVLHTVPAKWPFLVDVDQWQAVQRVLSQPSVVLGTNGETYRVRTKPAPQPRRHLLSGGRRRGLDGVPGEVYGVLRCAKCDAPLTALTQTRIKKVRDTVTGTVKTETLRVPAYACHPRAGGCGGISITPAPEVDAMVVKAIKYRLSVSPGLRQRLDAAQDAEAAHWRAERDAAKRMMLDAASLFGSRQIDRDSFDAMHGPAQHDHDVAEAKLAAMESDTTLPTVEEVHEGWDELTLKQQRAVVERLIGRIVVSPGGAGVPGFNAARVGEPEWLG